MAVFKDQLSTTAALLVFHKCGFLISLLRLFDPPKFLLILVKLSPWVVRSDVQEGACQDMSSENVWVNDEGNILEKDVYRDGK